MAAVPEELRCKRSDGKQWRCSAASMPDKTVCEKHYVQAKKRSASSALRASLRRSSAAGTPFPVAAAYADPPMAVARPFYGRVAAGEAVYVAEPVPVPAPYDGLPLGDAGGSRTAAELVGRSSTAWLPGRGVAGTQSCHQCRNVGDVIWCSSCDRRGYCANCIAKWYSDIPVDDVQKVCPACRGICNCKVCLQGDNLLKARVQEISVVDKLRYLHSLLACVLPLLKQIYSDQCFEIGVETRSSGPKTDILRAKMSSDEQICCDLCKVPVFDYHRHCPRCLYDLCLDCCRDIRHSRPNVTKGEYTEGPIEDRSKDSFSKRAKLELSAENIQDKSFSRPIDLNYINIRSLFPTWKVSNDGSITCGPHEAGGCGSSKMVLRRIFKINWIAKLVKCSEEMVNSCKVHDPEDGCLCLSDSSTLELTGQKNFGRLKCSNNDGIDGNCMYSPVLEDLKYAGISHFRKHWLKGEPIIIRRAFEPSLSSSWDPLSIWRGIQEIIDEKMDEDVKVKAVDCSDQSEVNIELKQFIKGYSDGNMWRDGHSMLKLKDWPQPSVLEEFLLCQRPEFIVNFPLVDFIHPRWGLLNLAAKLPLETLQPEVGMKLLVAHGSRQELGKGDSVINLMINMGDVVHMLMHTAEGNHLSSQSVEAERPESIANGNSVHVNFHAPDKILDLAMGEQAPKHTMPKLYDEEHASMLRIQVNSGSECATADLPSSLHSMEPSTEPTTKSSLGTQSGALWDVFCRHDLPKLNEYLVAHWEELSASQAVPSIKHAIYDQAVYLNSYHKKILKDQYGIEPWTFQQHIGEAVFIPAGCPFQVKNLQSTVQLALDFLSPESLPESARMAEEIRCLPNGHSAKLKMLEIRKMSLYAASSVVREIQRLTLDPKLSLDGRFEDQNLTRAVSENLARVNRQRKPRTEDPEIPEQIAKRARQTARGFPFRANGLPLRPLRRGRRPRRSLSPGAAPRPPRARPPRHWLVPARGHVGHSHHHGEDDGGEASERIFRLGLAADIALTAGKGVTGYLSGSTAIIADAAHSLSDIVLSGVALLSYKAARAPKDKEHPYGHGKFESLGALGISSMLLITSGGIAWHAFEVLQGVMSSSTDIIGNTLHAHDNHSGSGHHHGIDLEHPVLALSMTTLAICVKEGLYWITKKAGEKEGSGLMKANAWHHRADAISSVVALVGVGGSILGLPLLDPLAGLIVSGMILKAGFQTGYESILELVDAAVDPSLLQPIKETILKVDGVKGCHRLRGRKAGTSLYLDVHIEVYPFLSVSAAHDIGETVRHQIQKAHNQVAEVFIHIDPSYSVGPNMDQERILKNGNRRNSEAIPRQQNAEAIVSDIISTHFSKKMYLEHLILHYLQGRVLLQVQVSMPPEILIRDAMEIAKQAEEEILRADASISQVSVQLRLGQQIEHLRLASSQNIAHDLRAGVN